MAGNSIELGPMGMLLLDPTCTEIKSYCCWDNLQTLLLTSAPLIPKSQSHSSAQGCLGRSQLPYASKPRLYFIVHGQSIMG